MSNKAPEMAAKIAKLLQNDPEITALHWSPTGRLGFDDATTGERYILAVQYVGRRMPGLGPRRLKAVIPEKS